MAARTRPLPFLDKGVTPKSYGCILYSSQYGAFPSFSFLFCLNKDSNQLIPTDFPGRWLPALSASTNTPPDSTPTWDLHRYTQHPGWQGLRTDTGHPVGGTRRVGSHVTGRDIPDGDVLQKPLGLQRDVRCGAPILRQWRTGGRGVGSQDLTNGSGGESTRFKSTNMVSFKIVCKV